MSDLIPFTHQFFELIINPLALVILGCLDRSLMYARHSLYNECEAQSRNGGLVHLTVASVYLELGGFRRCLEVSFKKSLKTFQLKIHA